ncbi:MAG: hypothetical protein MZV64_14435 [Ignavibacteriales bacterium]|nr:hypothetical protein [Ignavibacteriales bacterium]
MPSAERSDLIPSRPPGLADYGRELEQARPAPASRLGKIRPGEERALVRCHHDRQRPAARCRSAPGRRPCNADRDRAVPPGRP